MKPEYKTKLFVIIILFLANFSFILSNKQINWDYNKGGADWDLDCKKGDQSPIDISQPFTHKSVNITFSYENMMTQYSFFNDGNNLILEGDYGYVIYNNITFFSSHANFYSPSMHTFSNKRMPLEIQLIHQDSIGNILSVSILFKYSATDYSMFLGKLGFDKKELQAQPAFKPVTIKDEINFSKYIKDGKDFFIYEGHQETYPCTNNSTYFILTDVLKASKKQLDNFPSIIRNKNKNAQPRNDRKIFTSFDMEELEKKQAEMKKKVEALNKIKEQENKVKQIQNEKEIKNAGEEKPKLNMTSGNLTVILNSSRFNETSPEYIKVQKEIDALKNKIKNHNSNETSCEDKDLVPFDVIIDKAKSYDDYIRSNDPKFIGNAVDKNQSMIIDKEIPKSDSEVKRLSLQEKYIKWKKLYDQSTNMTSTTSPHVFIQIKALEKELKTSEYEPYMKERKLFNDKDDDIFLSFIQLSTDSENAKFTLDENVMSQSLQTKTNNPIDENILADFENEAIHNSKKLSDAENILKIELKERQEYKIKRLEKMKASIMDKMKKKVKLVNVIPENIDTKGILPGRYFFKAPEVKLTYHDQQNLSITSKSNGLLKNLIKTNIINNFNKKNDNKKNDNNNNDDNEVRISFPFKKVSSSEVYNQNDVDNLLNRDNLKKYNQLNSLVKEEEDVKISFPIRKVSSDLDVSDRQNYIKSIENNLKKENESSNIVVVNPSENLLGSNLKDDDVRSNSIITDLAKNKMKELQVEPFNALKIVNVESVPVVVNVEPVPIIKIVNVESVPVVKNVEPVPIIKIFKVESVPEVKVEPVEVNVIKVVPIQVVPIVKDIKVTANIPQPKKMLDIPNIIQNDKITQLEKIAFDDKLEQYKKIKETFNQSVVEGSMEFLKPPDVNANVNNINEEHINKIENSNAKQIKKTLSIPLSTPEDNNTNNRNFDESFKFSENLIKYEKMRNIAEVLSHTLNIKNEKLNNTNSETNKSDEPELKQVEQPKNNLPIKEIFDTNLDYDKKIFNFFKLIFNHIIEEFKKLDDINSKIYSTNTKSNFLTSLGLIRITRKNLAVLIRKTLQSNSDDSEYDEKLSNLSSFFSKTLLEQNQKVKENNNYFDSSDIVTQDINNIIENINLKNEYNQYELKIIDEDKLRNLVITILQKLPIIILKSNETKIDDTVLKASDSDLDLKAIKEKSIHQNHRDEFEDDDVFITKKNASKIKNWKETDAPIFGPKIQEKINELNPAPGQGRKAASKDGTIDGTEIYNTSTWPDVCKTGLQSPININKQYEPELTKLVINMQPAKGKITYINDGYKLIFKAESFGSIMHGVHQYDAKQIEIHHPSEHTFGDDQVRSPLEIQIVLQDMFGNTAALAVLFKLDKEDNQFLSVLGFGIDNPLFALKLRNNEIIEFDDKLFGEKLNLGMFINNTQHYVTYTGSLTSPPCTQNVQWFVLLQKMKVSKMQLEYFPVLFGREANVRGLQSLNDRKLKII